MHPFRNFSFTLDRWTPETQLTDRSLLSYTNTSANFISKNHILSKSTATSSLPKLPNQKLTRTDFKNGTTSNAQREKVIKIPTAFPIISKNEDLRKKYVESRMIVRKELLKIKFLDISPFALNGNKSKKIIKIPSKNIRFSMTNELSPPQ